MGQHPCLALIPGLGDPPGSLEWFSQSQIWMGSRREHSPKANQGGVLEEEGTDVSREMHR
jgi:hypothetical protein